MSIEEVATRLGVHYMTVYRYVRVGRLPAERRAGRWVIRTEDLALSVPGSGGVHRRRSGGAGSQRSRQAWSHATRQLRDQMVSGDAYGAWLIIENALMAGTPSDVETMLLGPCMRRIGRDWEQGRIGVGDEHRATSIALMIAGRLSPLFGRKGRRQSGRVLLAGAEGDPHVLPLAMVADHLNAAGLELLHIGANVPVEVLVSTAQSSHPFAVGLSASTDQAVVQAGRAVTELHDRVPGLPVILGGPAVPSLRAARQVDADGWAPDAVEAIELFLSHHPDGTPA